MRKKNGAYESGFTLIVVLWLVALLTLILIGFQRSVGTHTSLARNAVQNARAEALADAGIHQAVLDIIADTSGAGVAGTKACRAGRGEIIETRIEDAGGRVDLNAASEKLLSALLAGLGASPEEAISGAAAIADYRDRDNEARPDGAEAAAYAERGLRQGPRNAALQTSEELEGVIGFTQRRVRELLPFVTVHSGMPGVDPKYATPRLLELLTEGQSRLESGGFGVDRRLPPEFASASTRQSFVITSLGQSDGARFVREAAVALSSARSRDFAFKSWKQGDAAAAMPRDERELDLCPGITGL